MHDTVILTVAAYFVFSAAVGALETPVDGSSAFYKWLFRFLHLLAGNIDKLAASRYPALVPAALSQGAAVVHAEASAVDVVMPGK